jgi:hypothetical protein
LERDRVVVGNVLMLVACDEDRRACTQPAGRVHEARGVGGEIPPPFAREDCKLRALEGDELK